MSDNIIDIIRKISPDFPIEEFMREAGGRAWYVCKRDFDGLRAIIKSDPCRNIIEVQRKYQVSREFVYSCWRG